MGPVFRALFELRPDTPTVVVLDEFQYLATGEDGLREVASELNAVWEGPVRRSTGLLVVLSGSAGHTMRALERGGSPLFGRLDWRRELPPFDYFDAGRMVERYDPRNRILTYAAFGGTPTYLDAVDDRRPVEEKIVRQLLAPDGTDRLGSSVEIDVVTRLLDRRLMAGEVRFRGRAAGAGLLHGLREKLERLAASGEGWARAALEPESTFLFASAGGFSDGFREGMEREPSPTAGSSKAPGYGGSGWAASS